VRFRVSFHFLPDLPDRLLAARAARKRTNAFSWHSIFFSRSIFWRFTEF